MERHDAARAYWLAAEQRHAGQRPLLVQAVLTCASMSRAWPTSMAITSGSSRPTTRAEASHVGFSNSPARPPASWQRIWAAGVSGQPGATNADIAGFHASSETPWLVYNPDDMNGRPFWLYYHDLGRSIAQNDGSTGYNASPGDAPDHERDAWRGTAGCTSRTVLPVRNYGDNQVLNHRGYAVVQRHGAGNWEAWHLGSDRSDHTYTRSLPTDGKSWTLDWFQTEALYRRWEEQQWSPPGWRLEVRADVFTSKGGGYAIGHMDRCEIATLRMEARGLPEPSGRGSRAVYIAPIEVRAPRFRPAAHPLYDGRTILQLGRCRLQ